jgi:hypothetical protein
MGCGIVTVVYRVAGPELLLPEAEGEGLVGGDRHAAGEEAEAATAAAVCEACDSLRMEVEDLQERLREVGCALDKSGAECSALKKDGVRMRDDVAKLKLREIDLNQRLASREDELERLRLDLTDKEQSIESLLRDLEARDAVIARAAKDALDMEAEVAARGKEVAMLRRCIQEMETEPLGSPTGSYKETAHQASQTPAPPAHPPLKADVGTDAPAGRGAAEAGEAVNVRSRRAPGAVGLAQALAVVVLVALGVGGGMLLGRGRVVVPSPPSLALAALPAWAGQRTELSQLVPGGGALGPGEFMTCGREEGKCAADFFLWMQHDGNLVLYRGRSPVDHRGPVWMSSTIQLRKPQAVEAEAEEEGGQGKGQGQGTAYHAEERAGISALVDRHRVLKLVDVSGRVVWRRRHWRLPPQLYPWPLSYDVADARVIGESAIGNSSASSAGEGMF